MATVKGRWQFASVIDFSYIDLGEVFSVPFSTVVNGLEWQGFVHSEENFLSYIAPNGSYQSVFEFGVFVIDGYDIVDFGEYELTVSDRFYAFLTNNATPYADPNDRKYTIKHGTLTAIGDVIREKLNTDTQYKPTEMPQAIDEVFKSATENLPDGYLKIDPTWTSWLQLFNGRPSMAQNLKYSDSANVTNMQSAFQGWTSAVGAVNATIPSLDMRKVTSIHSMFLYSAGIVEIGEMEIPKVTATNTAFNGCSNLERISFAPNCIKVAIGFPSSSKLDDASIQSIIDGLADLTGQASQKVTFHTDVLLKLTDEQVNTIGNKNWTF